LHGVVRPGKFTVFPQAIGMTATWNPNLILDVAAAISDEARGRWNELGEGELLHARYSDLLRSYLTYSGYLCISFSFALNDK
jgi:beta-glucosidase